jgi:two-component system, OmpR family, phosphate regulon sensor histidine kinase PhoR
VSSLYRHLLRYFLVACLVPLLLLGLFLGWDLEHRRHAELRSELHQQTLLARRLVEEDPVRGPALLPHVAGREAGLRLTLIRRDGTVVTDSHEDAALMENHRDRPEVRQALSSGEGSAERYSATLNQELLYVAMGVDVNGERWGVVRGAITLGRVREELARLRWTLLFAFGIAAAVAALLASRFSGRLSEPLDAVSRAVRQVGEGRWSVVSQPSGPKEVRQLTRDVNRMVERLRDLVHESEAGRAQLETILGQMEDGLLVLDREGAILRMNAAARRLLESDEEISDGRLLLETVPVYALDQAARQARAGEQPAPVEFRSPRASAPLRVLASPLRPGHTADGSTSGAILLIQDLTEIRRVDQMRRDFVANVSHELRTPIATLRALAETLILRGRRHPEILDEYVDRINGEVRRLGELVEDLLTLSRIESGRWELRPEEVEPEAVMREVIERFQLSADSRGVTLLAQPGRTPSVHADRSAVQTALGNLVDNALKYTPPGGEITLMTREEGSEVVFTVSDTGVGIPPEDLPRVFERFYRVDPARSQEVAGTGLGLAIVKHLCEQQGGRVWVESELGRSSRFHLALPAAGC